MKELAHVQCLGLTPQNAIERRVLFLTHVMRTGLGDAGTCFRVDGERSCEHERELPGQHQIGGWQDIEQFDKEPLAVLKRRYRELFGELPRVSRRDSLLRRIAWRLQVLAGGDLWERARQRAAEIANDAELRRLAPRDFLVSKSGNERGAGASRHTGDRRIPPPGTVLTRQYKDALIRVTVLREGLSARGTGTNP
jgi:hypothetical protein